MHETLEELANRTVGSLVRFSSGDSLLISLPTTESELSKLSPEFLQRSEHGPKLRSEMLDCKT